ncbi:MAG: AMMECR1 domain-containing protein, partial [Acidobacteriota bacterium]
MSHALFHLAREAIRHHLTRGAILDVSGRPGDGPAVGVFVSLHDPPRPGESEGRLRGCRGSIEPFERSLFAETVRQAVYSAVDDPRCESVRLDEVDSLEISVYLLDPPESIDGMDQLD